MVFYPPCSPPTPSGSAFPPCAERSGPAYTFSRRPEARSLCGGPWSGGGAGRRSGEALRGGPRSRCPFEHRPLSRKGRRFPRANGVSESLDSKEAGRAASSVSCSVNSPGVCLGRNAKIGDCGDLRPVDVRGRGESFAFAWSVS